MALIGRHNILGDTVMPANEDGARVMARDLVGLGHRRIGVIRPASLTTTHDRMAGFRSGLTESGATLPKRLVRVGDFTSASGEREMNRSLTMRPTSPPSSH